MNGPLAILGAGGHGAVVADAALAVGWREVAIFDDGFPATARCEPWAVLGSGADLLAGLDAFAGVVVAIGDNAIRLERMRQIVDAGGGLAPLVHPRGWVSDLASVGAGSVVLAGAMVGARAGLGTGVIVNTGATVDHDAVLAHGVHVSPGAHLAGGVRVGTRSRIGIGAVVRDGIAIGRDAVIGAGAVVVADVADGVTVVGNPARPLERRK